MSGRTGDAWQPSTRRFRILFTAGADPSYSPYPEVPDE